MSLMQLARSLFGRGGQCRRKSLRYRPEVETLEDGWVPSTISEFGLPPLSFGGSFGATAITAGPDGNVWFTDPVANTVGRITPSGQVTEFTSPIGGAGAITAGPDGNLWFTPGGLPGSPPLRPLTPTRPIPPLPPPPTPPPAPP